MLKIFLAILILIWEQFAHIKKKQEVVAEQTHNSWHLQR